MPKEPLVIRLEFIEVATFCGAAMTGVILLDSLGSELFRLYPVTPQMVIIFFLTINETFY